MTERAEQMRGHTRQHVPTREEPLILLVVDEIASLTTYQTDRKTKTEMEQLLGLIHTQGRAVGVSVLAAVQDPSKDTLAMRQLFPTRIALRLSEPTQAAMVLGQSARDRGALADLIPESTPGVGYVQEEERAEPVRVRAFHVPDTMIRRLAQAFAAKRAGGR
jgi:S-DNA-T family DNA segregation ATPase FtsK/SpoIIIE